MLDLITGGIGETIFKWTIGGAVSVFAFNYLRKIVNEIKDHFIRKIRSSVACIEDENLRQAAKNVVRWAARKLPQTFSGEQKLNYAIKKLQDITPDIIVSDEKVKVLIESAYQDFKDELKHV